MDPTVKSIVGKLKYSGAASPESIEQFRRLSGINTPDDYIEFLQLSNGAVGTVGKDQHVILWPVESLLERNRAYEVSEYAPGIFIFGSNGGGEAYGFDTRSSMSVVQVPFVGMDLKEVEQLAPSFTDFLIALEQGFHYA